MSESVNAASPVMIARTALLDAIASHRRAELSISALYVVADAYIAEIRAHGKRMGRKVPVPSRAHIIRALA